jgi:hypothetical protein
MRNQNVVTKIANEILCYVKYKFFSLKSSPLLKVSRRNQLATAVCYYHIKQQRQFIITNLI